VRAGASRGYERLIGPGVIRETLLRPATPRPGMDPRIREHATTIVDHSIDLQAGDRVVIQLPPEAEDLAVALYEICGDRGATPIWLTHSDRASRAFLRASGEEYETPDHQLACYENTDAFIIARGGANVTETSDVPPANTAAHRRAFKPVQEERLSKRWCLTQFPTSGHAQLAGMSTEAYEDFVWDAVGLDWDAQREFQAGMADRLDAAEAVRIVAGDETDLTLSVAGNHALNDYGEKNLPGGEVFTAPVPDSVEGDVHFDLPLYRQGREIQGRAAHLRGRRGRRPQRGSKRVATDRDPRHRRWGESARRARGRDEPCDRPVHLQHAVRRKDGRYRPSRGWLGLSPDGGRHQ
jgi:Leucyl aminopeptidase (aminopeptidase T)